LSGFCQVPGFAFLGALGVLAVNDFREC